MSATVVETGVIEGMGSAKQAIMHILDETGDTEVRWNATNADEVANAAATFERLTRDGFQAFADGSKMTTFDHHAEKIVFIPQMAGGA